MTSPTLPSGRRPYVAGGLVYDAESQDLELNATTGQLKGISWVDEGVWMSSLPRGSMKASPTTGNTIHLIKYLGGPTLQSDVESAWYDANPLKRLIANNDVTIKQIKVEVRDGRLWSSLYYVNNHTKESREYTVQRQVLETYG